MLWVNAGVETGKIFYIFFGFDSIDHLVQFMVTTRSKRLSTLETGLQPVRKRGKSASSALNDSVVSEVCEDGEKCYYLLKSEPESAIRRGVEMKFSIDDLAACEDQTECWDGVRNYEARNNLRSMNVGDHAFFYVRLLVNDFLCSDSRFTIHAFSLLFPSHLSNC